MFLLAVLGVRDQRNFEVLFVAESDVVSSGRVKDKFYNCAWCEFKSADTMVGFKFCRIITHV